MVFRILPGRLLWPPRLVGDDVSSPSSSYPSAGCSSAEPASVSLDKISLFPVSVSRRFYRKRELGKIVAGRRNGRWQRGRLRRSNVAVALLLTPNLSLGTEGLQDLAKGGGPQTATLAQLLHGDGLMDL